MKDSKKKDLNKSLTAAVILACTAVCTAACAAALLAMPEQVTAGARKGLFVCSNILIPSLFPFLVLSGFVSSPPLSCAAGRVLSPFTRALFGLPGECGSVILMSAVGGFPVGARMTADLYSKGVIGKNEAHRLLSFCVNAGPAFVITAVGTVMLGSKSAGLLIFAANTLSMLTLGILSGFFGERVRPVNRPPAEAPRDASAANVFTGAVAGAAESMLSICAWTVLFSSLSGAAEALLANEQARRLFLLFAEVTAGSSAAAKGGDAALISAVIGFGGFCVHCQVLPYARRCEMRYSRFFACRALNALLSFSFAKLFLIAFPQNIAVGVSSDIYVYKAFSVSVPAAGALLFMCAVLIFSFPPKRNGKLVGD